MMVVRLILGDRMEQIEVPDQEVLRFPNGIIGFEELTGFVLFELGPSLYLMQSVDEPEAGFVVLDPFQVDPSYRVPARDECAILELEDGDQKSVLCIVTMSPEGTPKSVNLRAPVIVNASKKLGMQLILSEEVEVRCPLTVSPDGDLQAHSEVVARGGRDRSRRMVAAGQGRT